MKILDLAQGSEEWEKARLDFYCASEAPAMMNASKFMSRNQLLDLKKGWQANPASSFTEKLWEDGHRHEDEARDHIEMARFETVPPAVGSAIIDGLELLASFDGLLPIVIWEHKSWNETLAENVRNKVLEPHYYWQLEHQMLVSDIGNAIFTVSDGTLAKSVSMNYESVPERRAELISGWKQFDADLKKHELKAKTELVKASDIESLPAITFEVQGSMIVSNIADCLPMIKERAESEISRTLETDQDFADKDKFNKDVKAARAKLKEVIAAVQGEFVSYSEFATTAAKIDAVFQRMQSHGEKQVKLQKAAKKQAIISNGFDDINNHLLRCKAEIAPMAFPENNADVLPDFDAAMKNKRTVESWQNAADSEVSRIKIGITSVMDMVRPNLKFLRENAEDHKFLFSDISSIINQGLESFQAVVNQRITDYKKAELEKAEAEAKVKADEAAKIKQTEEDKPKKIGKESLSGGGSIETYNVNHKEPVDSPEKPTKHYKAKELPLAQVDELITTGNIKDACSHLEEMIIALMDSQGDEVAYGHASNAVDVVFRIIESLA